MSGIRESRLDRNVLHTFFLQDYDIGLYDLRRAAGPPDDEILLGPDECLVEMLYWEPHVKTVKKENVTGSLFGYSPLEGDDNGKVYIHIASLASFARDTDGD